MADKAFSTTELTGMRSAQADHMMDTCLVREHSDGARSARGLVSSDFTDATPIDCGLELKFGFERYVGMTDRNVKYIQYNGILRVPIGTVITEKDIVRITHRHGEAITPALDFEVVSPETRGATASRYLLKKVV